MKRFIFSTALMFSLAIGPALALASEGGSFLSVKGKVLVKKSSGSSLPAKVGSKVAQGERIVTGNDAEASLQFFDGSQVSLKPGTDFKLTKLEKPAKNDKILQFKILVGELLAKVEKLTSPKSTFEVEAGGVVCGVRGTEFSMKYDSTPDHLDIHVNSGSVFAKTPKQMIMLKSGETGSFSHGDAVPTENKSLNYEKVSSLNKVSPAVTPTDKALSQDLALRDLKAQFIKGLQTNHDNVFTDPSVGGLSVGSITAKVGQNEVGP